MIRRSPVSIRTLQDFVACPRRNPACAAWIERGGEDAAAGLFILPYLLEGEAWIAAPALDADFGPSQLERMNVQYADHYVAAHLRHHTNPESLPAFVAAALGRPSVQA